MAWTTPKTDWSIGTSTQEYNGDRFTYRDFNRIKNNIAFLYEYAVEIYPISADIEQFNENTRLYRIDEGDPDIYHFFYLYDEDDDRTVRSFVYSDEINYFEERIHFLNSIIGAVEQPAKPTYYNDNGVFIDADELNRLENICLEMQPIILDMFASRRRMQFTLSQYTNHIDL